MRTEASAQINFLSLTPLQNIERNSEEWGHLSEETWPGNQLYQVTIFQSLIENGAVNEEN